MATINKQKIATVASVAAGATSSYTWKNYPQDTVLTYTALPVPPPAVGPHGTSAGSVEVTRVTFSYHRDNYNGDRREVVIEVKNTGTSPTGYDLWESWIS